MFWYWFGVAVLIPWAVMTLFWYAALVYERFFYQEASQQTRDFQVKVLTVGKAIGALKGTIRRSPKPPLVISRQETDLPGTQVLPAGFNTKACFKGEQLEWARQECPSEFTLYLDEDSVCSPEMETIPDADIVQFQETPITDKAWIAAIEAHRIGFQQEQILFEKTRPLYLWGGGFAVKGWLEDAVTWDRESITEDTAFVFAIPDKARFAFSRKRIFNQAPPSIQALVKQRRRWTSGTLHDVRYLKSWRHRWWTFFRTANWGLWTVTAPIAMAMVPSHPVFVVPLIQTMLWSAIGSRAMRLGWKHTIFSVVSAPVASWIHSVGALWGLLWPVTTFHVTPKTELADGDNLRDLEPVLTLSASADSGQLAA